MGEMLIIILSVLGLALGFVAGFFVMRKAGESMSAAKIGEAEQRAKAILEDAENQAKNIKKEKLLEVKEEWHRRKQEFENDSNAKKNKIQATEKQLKTREEILETKTAESAKKEKQLALLEKDIEKRTENLKEKEVEVEKLLKKRLQELERVAAMTSEEAKKVLMDSLVNEAKAQAGAIAKQIRDEAKLTATKEAKSLVISAIQRTASDHSIESTVSVVNLASEEMKGRIIGREGRNIRSFESATGIDLIIDDTPEAVVISGFDPFRREVARVALEKLMADGRIHPARIEELVEKTRKELEEEMGVIGERALMELQVHNMHPELVKMVGKMKYRTSYGQNLLSHSIEVATICGIMAAELGLDVNVAKRSGLLHDIGKCVDKSTEGPHALLGYEMAKKYKEASAVANAIGAHHEDIEMETPFAVLVQAADAISGARPGARRESLESYIKRLEKLEELAQSFEGVAKTFAIQAGREIRVMVEPEKIDDIAADQLAIDLAAKIESEMEYPGQIKVTVLRERRSFAFAK